MKTPLLALAFTLALLPLEVRAHDATAEMAKAANALIQALSPEQKARTVFELKDGERYNWHFIPKARKGLPLKEMTEGQRKLAHALLEAGLSHRGYEKATGIMSLEGILAELEKGRGANRDAEMYFVSVFGEPGTQNPWGWRFEGHHLSLNFTSVGEAVPAMTPAFFGSNPGEVREGPKAGLRVLGAEEDLARLLVKSLTPEQRNQAFILSEAPKDIINVPGRADTKPEGLPQSAMTPEQSELLMKLIKEYVGRHRADVAEEELAKLAKAGLASVHFAWAGGLERGEPHYYRVQSGSFVLEYDNTQNGANHVHSVWRDFSHEFGEDLLKKHYEQAHAPK